MSPKDNTNVVRKKKPSSTTSDLQVALSQLILDLDEENEVEAAEDLRIAKGDLERFEPGSEQAAAALKLIAEAFSGEHELDAYTFPRERSKSWGRADQLYLSSTRVKSLMKRLYCPEDDSLA